MLSSTPEFNSFFSMTNLIGYMCGLIMLKPRHRWNYFDHFINISGFIQAVQFCLILFICVPYFVFSNKFPFLYALGALLPCFYAVDSIGKFIYCKTHVKEIKELAEEFKSIYEWKREVNAKKGKLVKILLRDKKTITRFLVFNLCGNVIFNLPPLLISFVVYQKTKEWNPMSIYACWYPFDTKTYFWLIYAHEFVVSHNVLYWMLVPDGIFGSFLFLLNFYYTGLGQEMQNAINFEAKSIGRRLLPGKLKELIIYHVRLIRLTERMNHVFSFVVISRFLSSAFFLCCCGFVLVTADDPALLGQFAIFLGVILLQVYIFCLFGEKLSETSKLIGYKVFQSNLYDCNKEEMKMIQLIIMRSQKPSVVTISKFGIVSLPTFSSILTAAYQYMTLLRNLFGGK